MKKIFFLIVFFLAHKSFCQNDTDSLNYYYKKGDFKKAIRYSEELKSKLFNEGDHNGLAAINSNLGIMYYSIGDYKQAETSFKGALDLEEKTNGRDNLNYNIIQKHAAKNYKELGDFQRAHRLIDEAIEKFKLRLGENHPDYADALCVSGNIYKAEEKFNLSIPLFKKSSEIFKNIFGENEVYAAPISSLGYTYFLLGDYNKAEALIIKVVEILKKSNQLNVDDYAMSLSLLAHINIIKGKYVEAERYLFEALEILKVRGESNPKFIQTLSSLGYMYTSAESYEDAEIILNKTVELTEKFYGKDNVNTLVNKGNLSFVYLKQNKVTDALNLNLEVVNLIKKRKGTYRGYADILNNLALIYVQMNNFKEAERTYNEALLKFKKGYGLNHPKIIHILENISLMYIRFAKPEKAAGFINQTFSPYSKIFQNSSEYLSEDEIRRFVDKEYKSRIYPLSFLQSYPSQYSKTNIGCYETELLLKNISLRNQQRIKKSIEKNGGIELKEKYLRFTENKKKIAKLQELPNDEQPINYDQLILETENFEKDLTRLSSSFADAKKSLSITWKQVQEKLKTDEVAIDLVAFNYYNKKWTDSIVYGAFVVKKDSKFPKYVSLFEEKQLNFLLHINKEVKENDLINKQYSDKSISDLFLKPLESDLKGVKTIYLSPTGLGHQIDFNALPLTENQTFGERYNIHILGSTSELVNYKVASLVKNKKIELLLYGGIDFDKSNSSANNEVALTDFNEMAARSGISGWNYLEGTMDEINLIAGKAKQNNFKTETKTNREATEESIKKLDGKSTPYVLHLATHGFFFPDPKQEIQEDKWLLSGEMTKAKIYRISDDPMMRSGLLLAGANKYWRKTTDEQNLDDGILTAKEISNLDLSACELVVMSACETGLGDIKGSEGVFGLQRAFKMAGVKNIIMSLWKVPDAQTAELFDIFYEECFTGKSIHDSFKTAQSKMKAKYSPYYWAGFVLLE